MHSIINIIALSPGITIGFASALGNISANSVFTFLLLLGIFTNTYEIAQVTQGYREFQKLKRFLVEGILFRFSISEVSVADSIDKETYDRLWNMRVVAPINNSPLIRLFVLDRLIEHRPLGAWKGYVPARAIKVDFSKINQLNLEHGKIPGGVSPISPGYVFTDTHPKDFDLYDHFKIVHEMAHCTNFGIRTKLLSVYALATIFGLTLWSLDAQIGGWILVVLCIYIFFRFLEVPQPHGRALDEGLADFIAFQNIDRNADLTLIIKLHKEYLKMSKSMDPYEKSRRQFIADIVMSQVESEGDTKFPALVFEREIGVIVPCLLAGIALTILSYNIDDFFPIMLLLGFVIQKTLIRHFDIQNGVERMETERIVTFLTAIRWEKFRGVDPAQIELFLGKILTGGIKNLFDDALRIRSIQEDRTILEESLYFLSFRSFWDKVKKSPNKISSSISYFRQYFFPGKFYWKLAFPVISAIYLFEYIIF